MPIGAIEWSLHWMARLQTRLYTALLASQFRQAGPGSRVSPPFRFYGLNDVVLEAGAQIERNCWIQTIPDHTMDAPPKLVIGRNAGIGMGSSISAARSISIGDNVIMARNVYISDHAHAFEDVAVPIRSQGINNIAPVTIGENSWLGQNVVVLPGVTIGRHCVIGANAVVRSAVPDFSVAVGAPARVVRRYDPASRQWQKV